MFQQAYRIIFPDDGFRVWLKLAVHVRGPITVTPEVCVINAVVRTRKARVLRFMLCCRVPYRNMRLAVGKQGRTSSYSI